MNEVDEAAQSEQLERIKQALNEGAEPHVILYMMALLIVPRCELNLRNEIYFS